ncbi:MAG: T9SS type A sorting domain-containing protein [Flavobacteriales bacterium]
MIQVNGNSSTGNGVWVSSGSGSFDNPSQASTSYDPSSADTTSGSVQLSYISRDTGRFAPDTATLTVNFISLPTATAGSDIDTTVNTDSVSITGTVGGAATEWAWSSYGSGTFTDSSMLNTFYHPSQADKNAGSVNLLLTSTNNGDCPAEDVLNLNFTDTDISEHERDGLSMKLHPVPAGSELFVRIPRTERISASVDYELMDLTGRVLREGSLKAGTRQRIQVEDLHEGSYFLRIRTEKDQLVRKWIKR